jgi:uncharacterized damage-inducible protein DinB
MDLLNHFRRMAANNLWSNDRLYRAVLQLKPGEFEAERTSFFPSIKVTLNHILAVDHLYLDFLEEGGVGAAAYDEFLFFDEADALFGKRAAADRRLVAFCDRLSADDLDRRVITDRREDGMIPERPPLRPRHPSSRPSARNAVRHVGEAAAARRVFPRL